VTPASPAGDADRRPSVIVLAGPNGAGKSTIAPDGSALTAGRLMLQRLDELASRRVDFAFETTLASRHFAPWLERLTADAGYAVHIVFLWLPSVELALQRVADRVLAGGHDVPADVARRRYGRGMRNFLGLYRPLARSWRLYDDSSPSSPLLVARRQSNGDERALDETRWRQFRTLARS
jgi:predicted ABC-type ATPase